MFTFSFGSAFAALDSDVVSELKLYTTEKAQEIYYGEDGKIADLMEQYLNSAVYDADGYVVNVTEFAGYAKKADIEALLADMADYAELAFANAVSTFDYSEGNIDSKDDVLVALEGALATAYQAVLDEYKSGSIHSPIVAKYADPIIDAIFAAEKAAALDAIAVINADNYSDNLKEYVVTGAWVHTYGPTEIGVVGNVEYTAHDYVEAVLTKANAVIGAADHTTTGIDQVRRAAKVATEVVLGHKISATENYYIEAVPTLEELKADTSLDGAKASALAQIKAAVASKQIDMANAINAGIKELNKQAKLSDAQKTLMAELTEQATDLTANFANYEEVVAAKIGYLTTTSAVTSYRDAVLGEIALLGNNVDGDYNAAAEAAFNTVAAIVKNVKTLKADAELLAAQKDVNGKAYYDADVLAANLEDAIEAAYGGSTYAAAYAMLAGGTEAALIDAKIDYIDFIKGVNNGLAPKDSKGYTVDKPWNAATASNTAATIVALGNYNDGVTAMYDKAHKAELKALVAETKAAIEEAKTIAEVKAIFAAANDKYEAIDTTDDHQTAWAGKVGTAYTNKYKTGLEAYAAYFVAQKGSTEMAKYPNAVDEASEILAAVAYPIVYGAYTVDELEAKVADAKAAIDAIKTTAEIKAEKAAVEAAIKALPAVSAITVADKDAIVAAADMLDAYDDIPGYITITNGSVLDAAEKAYEAADAKVLKDAYNALKDKDITTADAAAIEALRAAYDAHGTYCTTYGVTNTVITPSAAQVATLETALSNAKVAEAKALMIKLPANPAAADKEAVEAARAAYNALTLAEKARVVNTLAYDNLIDAEEALGLNIVAEAYEVEALKITAGSTVKKGSITVKWTVEGNEDAVEKYVVARSTKKNSGFKKVFETTKKSYKNTKGLKKGTRYYYKVKAVATVDGVEVCSDWSNKAYRVAK